jgi:hypothetical protein
MESVEWRATAVPELRNILIAGKLEVPARFAGLLTGQGLPPGFTPRSLDEARTRIHYDRLVANRIGAGEMFWVSPDMTGLALDAAGDVPGFTPSTDLPAASGFMVLGRSLPVMDTWVLADGMKEVPAALPIDALSWTILEGMIFIEGYCRGTAVEQEREVDSFFEPVRFFRGNASRFFDCEAEDIDEPSHRLMQFLAAASHLMANPAVADRTRLVPKTPGARKAAKKGRTTEVTVVDLRAPHHVETGDASESGRVYTHRWIVRGHWRNQAHGKNHAQRRITWVPSYTKGPAGMPLKETERVWAWRR